MAKLIFACLLGLLLAMRLLAPAGFMPSFDGGRMTIVACPDGGILSPMPGHHDGHSDKSHAPCPYAAASALGSLAPGEAPLLAMLVFAAALLLGRTFLFLERNRINQRPYSTGPPNPRLI